MAYTTSSSSDSDDSDDDMALISAERWAAKRLVAPGARARVADAISDGYGVAQLIHAARPDLLRDAHAFEPGRAEAARNWSLLEARALKRLGVRPPPLDELLRGRDAARRRDNAARFLLELRRALKRAPVVSPRVTPRKTRAARSPPPPQFEEGAFEALVARLRRAAAGYTQSADLSAAKSHAFDERMDRLRATNRSDLLKTKGRIDALKAEVAQADVAAARCARGAVGARPRPEAGPADAGVVRRPVGGDAGASTTTCPGPRRRRRSPRPRSRRRRPAPRSTTRRRRGARRGRPSTWPRAAICSAPRSRRRPGRRRRSSAPRRRRRRPRCRRRRRRRAC